MKKKFSVVWPSKDDFAEFLRNEPKYLFWDAVGSFIYAVGISYFALNADFAPGGITGLGMILNYIFGLPIGTMATLANIPIILVSFKYLGPMYLLRTFQTLLMNALFFDVIAPMFPSYTGSPILAAIFAGICSGLGLAIIYKAGTCTGGSDLVIMSVKKVKPHLSIGAITMLIDGSLILVGAFIYDNVDAILLGIIFTIISTVVIDKYMAGSISGKMTFIISDHYEEITNQIYQKIGRGATILKGEGSYSRQEKNVLLVVANNKQLPEIREIVKEQDESALLIITDYSEVRGEGFIPMLAND